MATVPLRADNAYIGFAIQASQGTPIAPTNFTRWEDGTKLEYDMKVEEVREGDTSRRLSLLVKNQQSVKITLAATLRPVDAGFIECATMGSGSDTYTAPTVNTTLSSAASAGATTFSLTANTGLTASGTAYVAINPGQADYEVVAITTPGTGAGPYVYTIANSGTLKNNHLISEAVKGSASHVLADTSDGNYYTIEMSFAGASGIILRVRDCKVDTCKVSAQAGSLIRYEVVFMGIAAAIQVTPATLTWDPRPPFLFQQGTYTVDGLTTGDAAVVEMFDIERKNNTELVQTEQLTGAAIIFTKLDLSIGIDIVFTTASTRIQQIYFGGAAGTTDAQAMLIGSLLLLFTAADNFHTLQYNVPSITYIKTSIPEPKADGKHFKLALEADATSNMSANTFLMQTTVTNTQYAAYG
jgi:hypothetical protein